MFNLFKNTFLSIIILIFTTALSSAASYKSWNEVVNDMEKVLNDSYEIYKTQSEDAGAKGADKVNEAYYQYYEKLGFEKTVMFSISGKRVSQVEFQFKQCRKGMRKGKSLEEVKSEIDLLISYLREDANKLDAEKSVAKNKEAEANKVASQENTTAEDQALATSTAQSQASDDSSSSTGGLWFVFLTSFMIILREGFEAILIVGAVIAYLIKSNNQGYLPSVYWGVVIAIVCSFIMAWLLFLLTGGASENQEIIEGVTMLIAVTVLFYVSNFMFAKADSKVWTNYIKGSVQTSLSTGNKWALAFISFLAVFREGAEVILFYKAQLGMVEGEGVNYLWYGFGVGCIALVFVYILIRYLSIKIPLKPFFISVSLLMYVMCLSFLGNGIFELMEADVVDMTEITWAPIPTNSLLGIYPYYETCIPQFILFVIIVGTIVWAIKNWHKANQEKVAN